MVPVDWLEGQTRCRSLLDESLVTFDRDRERRSSLFAKPISFE